MTARQEGQQSVRDILSVMHPSAQTLKDIGKFGAFGPS
jgi:hypothetical protein